MSACVMLGMLVEEGRGVDESDEQAAALYRRACEMGHQAACRLLQELLRGDELDEDDDDVDEESDEQAAETDRQA